VGICLQLKRLSDNHPLPAMYSSMTAFMSKINQGTAVTQQVDQESNNRLSCCMQAAQVLLRMHRSQISCIQRE